MSVKNKLPNGGYEVVVLKKQDILKTIENTIVDKDVLREFITNLEIDEEKFMREGQWIGVPFMGNIKINEVRKKFATKEIQDVIANARNTLDRDKYLLFRKELKSQISTDLAQNRTNAYRRSINIRKNRYLYRKFRYKRGFYIANFILTTLYEITPIFVESPTYGTEQIDN